MERKSVPSIKIGEFEHCKVSLPQYSKFSGSIDWIGWWVRISTGGQVGRMWSIYHLGRQGVREEPDHKEKSQ